MKEEIWRTFYENGSIKEECPIKYGKLNGVATVYNEDGTIKEKRIYQNDLLMGNPFKGASPEKIAEGMRIFLIDDKEWQLALAEGGEIVEIDEKLASIISLNRK